VDYWFIVMNFEKSCIFSNRSERVNPLSPDIKRHVLITDFHIFFIGMYAAKLDFPEG